MSGYSKEASVTVLYDGSCPLCKREIAHYRRRSGAHLLHWVDASTDQAALALLGITRAQALARFHVRDREGCWHTGAAGFVLLWSQIRPYQYLAGLVRRLHLLPVMEWAYQGFLRVRSKRACSEERCSSKI